MKYIFMMNLLLLTSILQAQTIIPSPNKLVLKEGILNLNKGISIYSEIDYPTLMSIIENDIFVGFTIETTDQPKKADVVLKQKTSLAQESYELDILDKQILIQASGPSGFLYAIQSLRQLIHRKGGRSIAVKCMQIEDSPRQKFRSFMLDSGRQYQRVSTIKKYIDMLATLKMNYFHWHLTEGLGWRVEIKRYPQLTQLGSKVGKGAEQQGFYTQEEIKEVVKYAADRCITIIPEIDMPGHAEAAIYSYPSLGCFNEQIVVPEKGFTQHIFCAGKDSTITFLKHVLDEVCELFPSKYIHIGGDEALKDNWNSCADCQKRLKDIGLSNSHQLQLWFTAEMANHLGKKGRKTICWGDVVYHTGYPLPKNVVIQWWNWRGNKDKGYKEAIRRGLEVICGTNYYTYLNFPITPWTIYSKERTFDMEDVYMKNPSYYIESPSPLILGMSCALWTDGGVTEDLLDRRLFPRIFALAEQMWHKGELPSFHLFKQLVHNKQEWFESNGFMYGPVLREDTPNGYQWD